MAELTTAKPNDAYKVLVAIDFTDQSRRAVEFVLITLAQRITHLYLLHSYREKEADAMPMVSLSDILKDRSHRLMQSELEHFGQRPDFEHVKFVSVHRLEAIQDAITQVSLAENIDLVAISSANYRPQRLNSTDNDLNLLFHKISRPLLLVPKLLI